MGSVDQIKMKDLQTEAEKKPFAAAVKALWIEMFEDKESYVDHYMSSTWKHNRVLLLLRGEEIVSMLHLNPYTCIVQGERLDLHYIVGVCTKKAEQGKGYMGAVGYGGTSYLQRGRGAVYVSDAGGRGDLPSV